MDAPSAPLSDVSGVQCFAECPHFEDVSGVCTHGSRQSLLTYHLENAPAPCPMYDAYRTEQMALLEAYLVEQGR